MNRSLPPFPALRAFEAAARLGSFEAAAAELCVTQSAVSHQIKVLEGFLNSALFLRTAGGVELTQAGSAYSGDVTLIFEDLTHSTRKARETDRAGLLSVCGTPAFVSRWLLPRLGRFSAAFPSIELKITTTDTPGPFPPEGVDVLVQYGVSPLRGLEVDPFLASSCFPVCSPEYRARNPSVLNPGSLPRATLLRDVVGDGWESWFRAAGVAMPEKLAGPRFAHCELTLEAAEAGQGVALAYGALIEDQIAQGGLVRISQHETAPRTLYSLACLEGASGRPRIAAFRNWAFGELRPPAAA